MSLREDFNFPVAFYDMDKSGWFDKKNYTDRDSIGDKTYLWMNDIQWLSLEKIINYEYEDYQSKSIVPFGTTGGDIWGWHLDYKPIMPVVFCTHDDEEGTFYAKTYEGALFRQILDFASQNNFCTQEGNKWEMSLLIARKHLMNWKNKFEKWFEKEWINEIDRLIGLELKYYETVSPTVVGGYYVLITPEECRDLTKKYLDFELLDRSFIWVNED